MPKLEDMMEELSRRSEQMNADRIEALRQEVRDQPLPAPVTEGLDQVITGKRGKWEHLRQIDAEACAQQQRSTMPDAEVIKELITLCNSLRANIKMSHDGVRLLLARCFFQGIVGEVDNLLIVWRQLDNAMTQLERAARALNAS